LILSMMRERISWGTASGLSRFWSQKMHSVHGKKGRREAPDLHYCNGHLKTVTALPRSNPHYDVVFHTQGPLPCHGHAQYPSREGKVMRLICTNSEPAQLDGMRRIAVCFIRKWRLLNAILISRPGDMPLRMTVHRLGSELVLNAFNAAVIPILSSCAADY
jgi:hypothetical protein